jgi:hypothetical protein
MGNLRHKARFSRRQGTSIMVLNLTERPVDNQTVSQAATKLAEKLGADVIILNAPIYGPYDKHLFSLCKDQERRENCALFLCTSGGDADVAYRIARCLQQKYTRVIVYVCGMCKSAGTIIAIGAHEIVMTEVGELGPLDVQLGKKDELWETDSGLTVLAAIETLEEKAFDLFESAFMNLKRRSGGRITLKTATALASELSVGVISPIMNQIDPLHVGSVSRAMKIGLEYGNRLAAKSKNAKPGAIHSMTHDYPSHGFVIDRDEAKTLFVNVRELEHEEERELISVLGDLVREPGEKPIVGYLSNVPKKEVANESHHPGNVGTGSATPVGADGGDSKVVELQRPVSSS